MRASTIHCVCTGVRSVGQLAVVAGANPHDSGGKGRQRLGPGQTVLRKAYRRNRVEQKSQSKMMSCRSSWILASRVHIEASRTGHPGSRLELRRRGRGLRSHDNSWRRHHLAALANELVARRSCCGQRCGSTTCVQPYGGLPSSPLWSTPGSNRGGVASRRGLRDSPGRCEVPRPLEGNQTQALRCGWRNQSQVRPPEFRRLRPPSTDRFVPCRRRPSSGSDWLPARACGCWW